MTVVQAGRLARVPPTRPIDDRAEEEEEEKPVVESMALSQTLCGDSEDGSVLRMLHASDFDHWSENWTTQIYS
jgi:hypothetical protein